MSFRVLSILKSGWFNNYVEIEALVDVVVDRVKFDTKAVGLWVVRHNEYMPFAKGDRASQ